MRPVASPQTVLMLFSLSARREARNKDLLPGRPYQERVAFFDQLIRHSAQLAASCGIDWVWIDERKQQGRSFGERYANAFQALFDQGYTQILSIGSDSPELTETTLRQAVEHLEQGAWVLGPAHDGGLYLVGAHRDHFDFHQFCSLPWTSSLLAKAFGEWAQSSTYPVTWLAPLGDLDDSLGLRAFLLRQPRHWLARLAARILRAKSCFPIIREPLRLVDGATFPPPLRAPPAWS